MSEVQNLSVKTVTELYGLLADYQVEGESAFFKSCRVLYELDKKGDKNHPLLKKAIYKHYAIVFEKKVSPAIVLYFNGAKKFIHRMMDYRDTMAEVSADNKFVVAVIKRGEIVKDMQSGHQMSWATFDRRFPGGAIIREYNEQWTLLNEEIEERKLAEEAAIAARAAEPTLPRIRAESGKIIVNNEVFTLSELNEALQKLGFSVVSN